MPTYATITLSPAIDISLTLDHVLMPNAVHRVASETRQPGGKGVNVAKVLAAHGCEVSAGGLLGADNAAIFEQELSRLGICDRFVRIPGATRSNLMLSDGTAEYKINRPAFPELHVKFPSCGGVPSLSPFPSCEGVPEGTESRGRGGPSCNLSCALLDEVAARATERADVVIISGALPSRFPADTYARLIATLKAAGRTVVFDASGDALVQGATAKPHIIKPNRAECETLLGKALLTPESMAQACKELCADHEVVILSDGPRGCYYASGGTVTHAAVPDIPVVDTTAAGDTFVAYLLAGLESDRDVPACLSLAAMAAAITVSRMGAASSIPFMDEVRSCHTAHQIKGD